jgi:hypothetical protein
VDSIYLRVKAILDQYPEIPESTRSALAGQITQLIEKDRRTSNAQIQFLLGNYNALSHDAIAAIRQQLEKSFYEGI